MTICGVTEIQNRPALLKENDVVKIMDKRLNKTVGFFISEKYSDKVEKVIKEIEKKEKIEKLKKLKKHQDIEFLELGVDDGL